MKVFLYHCKICRISTAQVTIGQYVLKKNRYFRPWIFKDNQESEEVGHCMLPYIRDQILKLVNESLLVAEL